MITVNYCKVGIPHSDFDLEKSVNAVIKWLNTQPEDITLPVSTSNIITALKLAVVEGKIAPEQIQFKFEDEILKVNRYGATGPWRNGFADVEAVMSEKIITASIQIRNRERNEIKQQSLN